MSVSKNYYNTDLLNIEEILSILDMQSFLEESGKSLKPVFIDYIKAVIEFYTPQNPLRDPNKLPGNWHGFLFDPKWNGHGLFILNLLRLSIRNQRGVNSNNTPFSRFLVERCTDDDFRYSALTLNYDCVLESFCKSFTTLYQPTKPVEFQRGEYEDLWNTPTLAKLHGCVQEGCIVPPTWNKGAHKDIIPAWRKAYFLLQEANHIRFVGYSLPAADTYVKYLLKSAALTSPHLKTIDVICHDPTGAVKARYDEFVDFSFYRFANSKTEDYLAAVYSPYEFKYVKSFSHDDKVEFRQLEDVHDQFMNTARQSNANVN